MNVIFNKKMNVLFNKKRVKFASYINIEKSPAR